MRNLRIRVEDEEVEVLDALARDAGGSRAGIARRALREGLRRLRAERALMRYLNLEFTLAQAARCAGVTIREMAVVASARGIPFFRYSIEELRRDRDRGTR